MPTPDQGNFFTRQGNPGEPEKLSEQGPEEGMRHLPRFIREIIEESLERLEGHKGLSGEDLQKERELRTQEMINVYKKTKEFLLDLNRGD